MSPDRSRKLVGASLVNPRCILLFNAWAGQREQKEPESGRCLRLVTVEPKQIQFHSLMHTHVHIPKYLSLPTRIKNC